MGSRYTGFVGGFHHHQTDYHASMFSQTGKALMPRYSLKDFCIAIFTACHLGSTAAAMLGFYPVNVCPMNGTNSLSWAVSQENCRSPFIAAPQSISVASFRLAQTNIDPYVPRSNTYALAVFRDASISSAALDFEINDAAGKI